MILIASLAGLWRVLIENAELRLTGGTLSGFARQHPPKPWRGFDIAILNVSVNGEVRIEAHVSGHRIHTPIEISGAPEFDANARAVFFHVTETKLPRDPTRPMLSRLNAMLNPLATYIAQNVTDVIPAKRIKPELAQRHSFDHGEIGPRGWRRRGRGISAPAGRGCRRRSHTLRAPLRRLPSRPLASRQTQREDIAIERSALKRAHRRQVSSKRAPA